jgi:hypothetical protein
MRVLSSYHEIQFGCRIEKPPQAQTMRDVMPSLEGKNRYDSAARCGIVTHLRGRGRVVVSE